MRLANVIQLGVKELRALARDPMLAVLIVYAFTLSIYTASTAMPETLNNAAIAAQALFLGAAVAAGVDGRAWHRRQKVSIVGVVCAPWRAHGGRAGRSRSRRWRTRRGCPSRRPPRR